MRTLDALVSTLSLCALVAAMIIASPAIADADLEAAAEDPVAHDAVEQRLLDLDPEHCSRAASGRSRWSLSRNS